MKWADWETITVQGRDFAVMAERDDAMGEPWVEHDGHGIVSGWTSRDKRAGERVLSQYRGSFRYYDVAATMRKARAEGWGSNLTGSVRERAAKVGAAVARGLVDEFMTVDTDAVCAAIKDVFVDTRSIVEPAGALAVAAINVERHGLQERIQLVHSDGLTRLTPPAHGPFDLILCNPPYVCQASMDVLPAEYRAEPELALAGGTDGMDFVRQLLRDAPAHMREHAVLVLEIGNECAHFEAAFPELEVAWLDTSSGEDQVLLITRDALLSLWEAAPAAE